MFVLNVYIKINTTLGEMSWLRSKKYVIITYITILDRNTLSRKYKC